MGLLLSTLGSSKLTNRKILKRKENDEYQKDFINSLDLNTYTNVPLYRDKVQLSEVIVYKNKKFLRKEAEMALFGDRIVIDEGKEDMLIFPFGEASAVTVLGKNKLNIYYDKKIYQIKSNKRFNALKYVNIYNRFLNISKKDTNGKFLGL